MKDGVPYEGSTYRYRHNLMVHQDTYVHPETKLLCKTPKQTYKRPRKLRPDPASYCPSNNPEVCYAKNSEGIWYECFLQTKQLTQVPIYLRERLFRHAWVPVYNYYDVFLHSRSTNDNDTLRTYGLRNVYCVRKRQLNKKEIRKITSGALGGVPRSNRSNLQAT